MRIFLNAIVLFLFSNLFAFGCSLDKTLVQIAPKTESGFAKKEIVDVRRVAILPFEGDSKGEAADAFALSLREKFPQLEVVERKEVQHLFKAQDFSPGWPDETTRMKIGKTFDVQAVVSGSVYYPSILRWLLQVKIIDVETGSWVGQSSVEIGFSGALGLKEGCKLAVESLKMR